MSAKVALTQKLNDKNAQKIRAAMKKFEGSYVSVGVHNDAGTYESTEGKEPVPVAKVAWWLENGTQRMPARPFFYPTLRHYEDKIGRLKAEGYVAVALAGASVEHVLAHQGFMVQSWVQNTIKANVPPALSEAYARRRQSAFPESGTRTLIASGLLLRSVRYKVSLSGGDPVLGDASGPEPLPSPAGKAKTHNTGTESAEQAKATMRELSRQQGETRIAKQKLQRAEAKMNPERQRARFSAQRRAFVTHTPKARS